MILDLHDLPAGACIDTEICIVGAGAAGISMALSLAKTGRRVVVLESGGMTEEPETQQLYVGEVVDDHLHSPLNTYRQRRFGGTTTIWGGRCMPYDEIDFEQRHYIPHSGWPITRREVEPYYVQANRLCEAGEFSYSAGQAFTRPLKPMLEGFDSPMFSTDRLERFSCPTDFGRRYEHKLRAAANVRLMLHANVIRINKNDSGTRVASLLVATLSGRQHEVKFDKLVLATGGLEVPRLLLTNQLGNDHDVVGKYYMCHIAGTVGSVQVSGGLAKAWHGYDIADDGSYCRRRIALTEEAQRREQVGNMIARLHHPRITDPRHHSSVLSLLFLARPLIPYEYAKRLHGDEKTTVGQWLRHVANVTRHPLDAVEFAWHMLRDRKLAERKFPSIIVKPRVALFSLDFHAEQEPNPASRVMLADAVDALGVRQLRVDWRYTRGDVRTVEQSLALLRGELARTGVAQLDYDPAALEEEMTRYGAYGGHHSGTARMGTNRQESVVDANCRVHGMENLYIAGAAVFPTSSQANPTLTVVALALRLAEHLRGAA